MNRLDPDPFSAYFGLKIGFTVVKSKLSQIVIRLKFIENFIFLVKNKFATKFQKLASERNIDIKQIF